MVDKVLSSAGVVLDSAQLDRCMWNYQTHNDCTKPFDCNRIRVHHKPAHLTEFQEGGFRFESKKSKDCAIRTWEPLLEKVAPDRREFPGPELLGEHYAAVRTALAAGAVLGVSAAALVARSLQRPRSPKSTVVVQSLSRPQSPENVQVFTSHIEPVDIPEAKHSEMPEDDATGVHRRCCCSGGKLVQGIWAGDVTVAESDEDSRDVSSHIEPPSRAPGPCQQGSHQRLRLSATLGAPPAGDSRKPRGRKTRLAGACCQVGSLGQVKVSRLEADGFTPRRQSFWQGVEMSESRPDKPAFFEHLSHISAEYESLQLENRRLRCALHEASSDDVVVTPRALLLHQEAHHGAIDEVDQIRAFEDDDVKPAVPRRLARQDSKSIDHDRRDSKLGQARKSRAVFGGDDIKDLIRSELAEPGYDVKNLYKTTGWAQYVARHVWFENVTMTVIVIYAIYMSVDADWNPATIITQTHPVFIICEQVFCLYFFAELLIRFLAFQKKMTAFKDGWFLFDFVLVFMMVAETWVLNVVIIAMASMGDSSDSNFLGDAAILRMARLMRLTRLARMARIIRKVPELLIMVKAVASALRSVGLALLLLGISVYVFAIAFRMTLDGTPVGASMFSNCAIAMHTLIMHGTFLDAVSDVMQELLTDSIPGGAQQPAAAEVVTTFGGDATKAETEEKEGAQATETKEEQGKRSASSEGPAAKRTCPADGVKVVKTEKDGNCLFASLALGLNHLSPDDHHKLTAAEVRAKIAVHLKKNEDVYRKTWDKEMPDRTEAKSWTACIEAMEADKTWGGLMEWRAACRVFDVRCVVFSTSEHLEPL
eukprot:s630_g12.t1